MLRYRIERPDEETGRICEGGGLMSGSSAWTLGVIAPLAGLSLILEAEVLEGPRTAYLGLLAVVPMFAAAFAGPAQTAFVGAVTWLAALGFGISASDGTVQSQWARLAIIAIASALAVVASALRLRQERRLTVAERASATIAEVRRLSETDELTGVLNRRGLLRALEPSAVPDRRAVLDRGEGLDCGAVPIDRTIALLDIDGLKQVNDTFGHLLGDAFITAVADRLSAALAGTELIGRWGGDEFLIVLDTPASEGMRILDLAHDAITAEPARIDGRSLPISVSLGAAPWPAGATLDSALAIADGALYQAKSAGRNRTTYPK